MFSSGGPGGSSRLGGGVSMLRCVDVAMFLEGVYLLELQTFISMRNIKILALSITMISF